jgi:hypothetical protein
MENAELWERFSYSPLTGLFYYNHTSRNHLARAGDVVAPTPHSRGYVTTRVGGKTVYYHRAVFQWVTGREPHPTVEHLNHNKADNRWNNLIEATHKRQSHFLRNNQNLPDNVFYKKPTKRNQGRYDFRINHRSVKSSTDLSVVLAFRWNYLTS